MSDSPKQCGPSSAPSTSKQPPTRPLKQFTVLNTESYGPKQPKPATVNDRPRNLLPTSHRTHAANLKPDPDDPRNVLSKSTEHNPAPSSVTLRVPHTSRRIVDTAGVEGGSQTFHRRPCIEHRQHSNSKSTVEYQPALQGDRQEPLAGDATTFVDPPRPQIFAGLPSKSQTETRFEFKLLLTARATARGKLPLLCTGVVSPLLRVQPPQRHKTALRVRRINGKTSCTIKVWPYIPLAYLK